MEFLEYVSSHLKNGTLGINNHFQKKYGHILKNGPHPPVSKIVRASTILNIGGWGPFFDIWPYFFGNDYLYPRYHSSGGNLHIPETLY